MAWTSQPPEDWRKLPIGKRPRIGHQLLEKSLQSLKAGSTDKGGKQQILEVDLDWAGAPLRIGALNVGFRGLMPSLQSVTQLLMELRCDILFLGDLRTAQR